jgi:hypothetical protein
MANTEAYLVLKDTALPKPVRTVVTTDGVEIQETMGQAYGAGDYVLRDELSARDQERVDNGDLDHLLEAAISTRPWRLARRSTRPVRPGARGRALRAARWRVTA